MRIFPTLQKPRRKKCASMPPRGFCREGEGTLDDPQLTAIVPLPPLQLRQNSIAGLKAEVHVANHAADLTLDSKVSGAYVRTHGRVALTGDYYTEAAIDTGTVPLDVLMATYSKGAPQGF